MLKLHKDYSISFFVGITKKLIQQYVNPFQIIEKIGWLAYKLKVLSDWLMHSIFSVAQLEPASNPSKNPFHRSHSQ